MKTVSVDLGDRSYNIVIGSGLLGQSAIFDSSSADGSPVIGQQVVVATNRAVSDLYLQPLLESLGQRDIHVFHFDEGESAKTLQSVSALIDFMIDVPCDRFVTVVALGGGVVGDMAGFASACYQRGTRYVQMPTTLLAQVDSSVGGKTAVNHKLGKNMIGAFHQPNCVIADTDTLASLSDREYRAGLAEVIKYGIIHDAEFFLWLENNRDLVLAREPQAISHIIATSCQAKADIVRQDEQEHGVRALLNLGHTFGHAIEAHTGYATWLHGEAVATGMIMASMLSNKCNHLESTAVARIHDIVLDYELPVHPPADLGEARFMEYMQRDKKVRDGVIRFVLPTAIGKARVFSDCSAQALTDTINECQVRAAAQEAAAVHS